MKKLFSIIACFAIAVTLQAQIVDLKGKVGDTKGKALVGANIHVKGIGEGTVTDFNGEFNLKLPANRSFIISISYVGYTTYTFTTETPLKKYYNIVLEEAQFIAEEVVVSATRAGNKTPMAYKNLSKEDLTSQNMGQDIGYMLSLTPSVVQSSESGTGIGYTNFRIRGTDPSRINITVDGIPLNDAESQQVFWVNMPSFSNSLSSIQIQRGVGTSTNGAAAFGATVNMQTESASQNPYAEVSSTFGTYNTCINTVKAGSGLIKNKMAFDFRYSKLNSDGYVDYTSSDNQSMQLTGSYFTKNGRIKANIILGEQHSGISWWGIDESMLANEETRTYNPAGQYTSPSGEERYYENQTDNYWQNHYHLVYSSNLSEHLFLNTAIFYVDGEGYYEQYKEAENLAEYYHPGIITESDTINSTDLVRQKWLDNNFYGAVFSLTYKNERSQLIFGGGINNYVGEHFGNVIWMQKADPTLTDYEWYRNDAKKLDANLYIKANYDINDQLNIFADMQYRRVDYFLAGIDDDGYMRSLDQDHHFNFFNPKAGVNYLISSRQKAYASLSVGNREPSRTNFKDATGDDGATPKAEQLQDLELGYNYSGEKAALAVNLYYMNYINQLVPTGELSNDGYPVMTNMENSYRRGIEISAGINPISWLEWNANLTLSQNKILNYIESYTDYDADWNEIPSSRNLGDVDIAYSPSIIASSDFAFMPDENFGIHLISQYVSAQYFVNTMNENMKIDSWFVNNLRVDYSFPVKDIGVIGLQLQVNNLFNEMYENNAYGGTWWQEGTEYYWSAYFPQATRNYLMKINLRF